MGGLSLQRRCLFIANLTAGASATANFNSLPKISHAGLEFNLNINGAKPNLRQQLRRIPIIPLNLT
jgi:hypothetical protein